MPFTAHGALLLYEGFDYGFADGTSLAGANGGTGAWNGSWTAGTHAAHFYTTTGLTYSNGGTLVVNGGAMIDRPGDGDRHSTRAVLANTVTGTSETFWFSYLLRADNSLFERVKFEGAGGDANVNAGFGTDNSMSNPDDQLGASLGSTNSGTTRSMTDGEVVFVVGRIMFDGSGNGTLDNWYNIALTETEGTIGAADSSVSVLSGSLTLGNLFEFRSGNNHEGVLDEIRLGNNLTDVIPVPEPSSFALLLGGLALSMRRRR